MITDSDIASELSRRYGRSRISKSSMIMAIHYYLRCRIDNGNSNIDYIEKKIKELKDDGVIIQDGYYFKVA